MYIEATQLIDGHISCTVRYKRYTTAGVGLTYALALHMAVWDMICSYPDLWPIPIKKFTKKI